MPLLGKATGAQDQFKLQVDVFHSYRVVRLQVRKSRFQKAFGRRGHFTGHGHAQVIRDVGRREQQSGGNAVVGGGCGIHQLHVG